MLHVVAAADVFLRLDEAGACAHFLFAQAEELVGVGAVLAADHKGGIEGFGQRPAQGVLVDLGGIA